MSHSRLSVFAVDRRQSGIARRLEVDQDGRLLRCIKLDLALDAKLRTQHFYNRKFLVIAPGIEHLLRHDSVHEILRHAILFPAHQRLAIFLNHHMDYLGGTADRPGLEAKTVGIGFRIQLEGLQVARDGKVVLQLVNKRRAVLLEIFQQRCGKLALRGVRRQEPVLMVEHEAGDGKKQQQGEAEQREINVEVAGPLDQQAITVVHHTANPGHDCFFLAAYSMIVAPVSALASSVMLAGSGPHTILADCRVSLPCSRWTSTNIVYVPCGSTAPLSSLPSQTS